MDAFDRAVTPMRLADLVRDLPGLTVVGDPATLITTVVADSRSVVPGAMFVALSGTRHDGRSFAREAVGRGAHALVLQVPVDLDVVQVLAEDCGAVLPELAARIYRNPSRRLRVTAVTGTDGKTTTGHVLEHLLRSAGRRTGVIGSLGTCVNGRELGLRDSLTTPRADDVQYVLSAMVRSGVQEAIVEASSAGLARGRLDQLNVDAAVITNITDEHLEAHGGRESYSAAKGLLLQRVMRSGGSLVLNDDDRGCRLLRERLGPGRWVTYGVHSPRADVRATDIDLSPSSSRFTLHTPTESRRVQVGLPGRFNVANVLAAATAALDGGIGLDEVTSALHSTPAVPGRMTPVDEGQPFAVWVDYAHTIAAVGTVLAFLRANYPQGRLIVVLGSGRHLDHWKRGHLVEALVAGSDLAVLTVSDAVWESSREVVLDLARAASSAGGVEGRDFVAEPDRGAAIEYAVRSARPGDVVAVLGKGHETHIDIDGRSAPWSDESAVRGALRRVVRGQTGALG